MDLSVPRAWHPRLAESMGEPYFDALEAFVRGERAAHAVYPPEPDVFNALRYTPYDRVKVVILGQDPYHGDGQAHGLSFSVRPGVKAPPSLANIFKELRTDLGCAIPGHGYLVAWAERGVLLLNTVLTVRAHEPNSHRGRGWERFTDTVIRTLNEGEHPVAFLLWGAPAQKKLALIDAARHPVIASAHPSPLSAHAGFLGSRPFSRANEALQGVGRQPVDWALP